jgi:hypothetical protein
MAIGGRKPGGIRCSGLHRGETGGADKRHSSDEGRNGHDILYGSGAPCRRIGDTVSVVHCTGVCV